MEDDKIRHSAGPDRNKIVQETKSSRDKAGKRRGTGSLEILAAAAIWGYGYIVIRDSLDQIPFSLLMTLRYGIAWIPLLVLFRKRFRSLRRELLAGGALAGAALYISQYFQTAALGQADTTAGKVAFITALYVVLVPLAGRLFLKTKTAWKHFAAAMLAALSLMLLTGAGIGKMGQGDFLALVGSLGFSVHILLLDYFTKRGDAMVLTSLQYIFAFCCAAMVQLIEGEKISFQLLIQPTVIWPLLYLGLFSTMLGFLLQTSGQRSLRPEIAAMLLATEAIFGMLFSVWLLDEALTPLKVLGCVLMAGAIVLVQWEPEMFSKNAR